MKEIKVVLAALVCVATINGAMPSLDEALSTVWNNYEYWLRSISSKPLVYSTTFHVWAHAGNNLYANVVTLCTLSDKHEIQQAIDAVRSYATTYQQHMGWWITPQQSKIRALLETSGFMLAERNAFMVNPLGPKRSMRKHSSFTVKPLNAEDIDAWLALVARTHGYDHTIKSKYRRTLKQEVANPNGVVSNYAASYKGVLAATGSLMRSDRGGNLYHVAVSNQARNSDIKQAMVSYIMGQARNAGLAYVVTIVDAQDEPWYIQHRFNKLCDLDLYHYENKPSDC